MQLGCEYRWSSGINTRAKIWQNEYIHTKTHTVIEKITLNFAWRMLFTVTVTVYTLPSKLIKLDRILLLSSGTVKLV